MKIYVYLVYMYMRSTRGRVFVDYSPLSGYNYGDD